MLNPSWLTRTLEVWRPATASDGMGGQAVTLQLLGTVRAKVDQPAAADRLLAQQSGSAHTHTVYLLPDADVARGDELRGDGQVLKVHATAAPSRPDYLRADCALTQTEGT